MSRLSRKRPPSGTGGASRGGTGTGPGRDGTGRGEPGGGPRCAPRRGRRAEGRLRAPRSQGCVAGERLQRCCESRTAPALPSWGLKVEAGGQLLLLLLLLLAGSWGSPVGEARLLPPHLTAPLLLRDPGLLIPGIAPGAVAGQGSGGRRTGCGAGSAPKAVARRRGFAKQAGEPSTGLLETEEDSLN